MQAGDGASIRAATKSGGRNSATSSRFEAPLYHRTIHSSLNAHHLWFTIEAHMETDEIHALAKVAIHALDKR
jgi:hypothetical protein